MNDRAPQCTAASDPWLREAVGAYLLGALEPAESDRVSAHLSRCASCRAEYGELVELLPLLASVTEADAVNGPVRPEPVVLGRVLASTSRQLVDADARASEPQSRPRRRRILPWNPARTSLRTRIALSAASFVVVAGGILGAVMATSSSTGLPAGSWSTTAVSAPTWSVGHPADSRITASIDVMPATHGSKIQLKLDNVPAGYECAMVVVGANGAVQTTGTWKVNTGGSFVIPGWSPRTPDLISAVKVIELPEGDTLLTLVHPST